MGSTEPVLAPEVAKARKSRQQLGCVLLALSPIFAFGLFGLVLYFQAFHASPTGESELPVGYAEIGAKPGYCPGRFLKHLGAGDKGPPCVVEHYLSRTLKDPDSFQSDQRCSMTPSFDAWIVRCTYRARNSFGGMNFATTTFHVKNDRIVKVE